MNGQEGQYWYAVYVRSRFEKKVHQFFLEKGITSYLPLVETWRQWSDRKKKVSLPLFKGYVFVRIAYKSDHYKVLDTDGVVKFVGIRNVPSVIIDRDIEWIKILAGEPDALKDVFPGMPYGQKVKVITGPFLGLEGVVRKEGRGAKLVVYFDSIMQGIEVLINPEFLQPIQNH
ncbi:UpxY family transcription antiterminator [Prosthecochloris sp.]|uniref:UpxY family transcription antiterminator n=1 Tax=Prosthecochloris sp. TaxID=290513 RepID=UPI0025EA5504|nr:UpxY family transcription antiterminator [Prosthecochloris sp.]